MLRSLALEMLSAACLSPPPAPSPARGRRGEYVHFGSQVHLVQYRVPRQQSTAWYLSIPPLLTFLWQPTRAPVPGNLLFLTFLCTAEPSPAELSLPSNLVNREWWTAGKNAGAEAKVCSVLLSFMWYIYLIVSAISSSLSFLVCGWLVTRLFGITSN